MDVESCLELLPGRKRRRRRSCRLMWTWVVFVAIVEHFYSPFQLNWITYLKDDKLKRQNVSLSDVLF